MAQHILMHACREKGATKVLRRSSGSHATRVTATQPLQADMAEVPKTVPVPQTAEACTQTAAVPDDAALARMGTESDHISWGTKGESCSAWKQTYKDFLSRRWGHVCLGDIICAESADVGKLFIKV